MLKYVLGWRIIDDVDLSLSVYCSQSGLNEHEFKATFCVNKLTKFDVKTKNLDDIFLFLFSVITVNNEITRTKLMIINERWIKLDMSWVVNYVSGDEWWMMFIWVQVGMKPRLYLWPMTLIPADDDRPAWASISDHCSSCYSPSL